jgi:sentrin-specific protease 7
MRKASRDPLAPKVHCFSSHFFTTLVDEGPVGVRKWTERKSINIFDKKFVFMPINEALHWSLCVVVHPGSIVNDAEDAPMSCLIFLDSLKAHRKKKVSQKVRAWLNFEWRRINGGEEDPFTDEKRFPLLDPRSESCHLLSLRCLCWH